MSSAVRSGALPAVLSLGLLAASVSAAEPGAYRRGETWQATMQALRETCPAAALARAHRNDLFRDHPIEMDWLRADSGGADPFAWFERRPDASLEVRLVERALEEIAADGAELTRDLESLRASGAGPGERAWLDLYSRACEARRRRRLAPLISTAPRIVFTKHYNLGGSHYAYTEGLSDAQNERHFVPGSSLCLLDLQGDRGVVRDLLTDPGGVIRDPDVCFDGRRVLFSWKRSDREDDYHLHELDTATGEVRRLTSGLGVADYEGVYLPDGSIVFNSTRCIQTVDCWWTEVSNLYACDGDGGALRRLSHDQVHTNCPQVLDDGTIVYTRWDYSDRGQIYPQGLFRMAPDGTGQMELYGNSSWFPTTILHARPIPGTRKLVAILTGHHSIQVGKLATIDVGHGRQEDAGVQLLAPVRATPAVRVDAYGQDGDLFQYPWPLSENEFVVAYSPGGHAEPPPRFSIYWMAADGRRELLCSDPGISCNQPVPLRPRPRPPARASTVDWRKSTATYHVADVYSGQGLAGVPRGAVDRIRVVALEFRAAGIGYNHSKGPGGAALSSTPVSVGNGCWDVKVVLGDAKVHEDGSACFVVPARTPVYFQALDRRGRAIQSMRSWSTLQPGELLSCAGCHESKNEAPRPARSVSLALLEGPSELAPFHGAPRGFSFAMEVQPILDRHCVACHRGDATRDGPAADAPPATGPAGKPFAFSLLARPVHDPTAKRYWTESYLALTSAFALRLSPGGDGILAARPGPIVDFAGAQSAPPVLDPGSTGSSRSPLIRLLDEGHHDVRLDPAELETLACWIDLLVPFCGDYREAGAWSDEERAFYEGLLEKRRRMAALDEHGVAEHLRRLDAGR